MAEAAPARFMLFNAWVLISVCGEPVFKRATQPSCPAMGRLWILILVAKEESSIDTTSATRQGPRSASKGRCSPHSGTDNTARTSPLWSEGTFGTDARYPDGEAAADVSSGHSRCRVEGSTPKMQSLLEDELPRGNKGRWRVGGDARSRKRRRTVCRALLSKRWTAIGAAIVQRRAKRCILCPIRDRKSQLPREACRPCPRYVIA